jgi:hypothetical protein
VHGLPRRARERAVRHRNHANYEPNPAWIRTACDLWFWSSTKLRDAACDSGIKDWRKTGRGLSKQEWQSLRSAYPVRTGANITTDPEKVTCMICLVQQAEEHR